MAKGTVNILSLGAGVQSSTMIKMAEAGLFKINGEVVIPDYAIFSDTGNEPIEVYKYLEWLKANTKIPIIVTSSGNIIRQTLRGIKDDKRFASVPFFVKNIKPIYEQVLVGHEMVTDEDGTQIEMPIYKNGQQINEKVEKGILWRQCTSEYKIMSVRREIRRLLGYGPRERIKEQINLWMGISNDEIQRVKPSQVKWINNYYPLIENDISRLECLSWMESNGFPLPAKSSCIICPYHSDMVWKDMKLKKPKEWEFAVKFDKRIRKQPKINGDVFLHRSCIPLEEVDFKEDQLDLFTNECEGMCGI